MKFDVMVVVVPKTEATKPKKYLLAKKELSTELQDELIAEFEKIYLPMEQNLLKVSAHLARS